MQPQDKAPDGVPHRVPNTVPNTVIVHSLAEAVAALAEAQAAAGQVVLISAPGAALHAGCGWWRALVEAARARYPDVSCTDVLDCADGTGQAMAALRIGITRLVLWPDAPGREAVRSIAESMGGFVLAEPPPVDRGGPIYPDATTAMRGRTAGLAGAPKSEAAETVTNPCRQANCNFDKQTLPGRGPAPCE